MAAVHSLSNGVLGEQLGSVSSGAAIALRWRGGRWRGVCRSHSAMKEAAPLSTTDERSR